VQEDFAYLTGGAPGALFGEKRNPLAQFYSPKCLIPSAAQPVRIRKTCCYYYQLSDKADYCVSCPKKNRI
jgi:ferric iron reductase protein FhuF